MILRCAVCAGRAELWMYDIELDRSFPVCADCLPDEVVLIEEMHESGEDRRDPAAATSAA